MLEAIIIVVCVLIDQATKMLITTQLYQNSIAVIPGVVNLTYCENTGAAFSIFSSGTLFLVILSSILIVVMTYFMIRFRKHPSKLLKVSLAMIVGGALGNLIDRIFMGYVVDFIDVKFVKFAVFNGADSFVTIGTILLAVYILFYADKHKKTKAKEVVK